MIILYHSAPGLMTVSLYLYPCNWIALFSSCSRLLNEIAQNFSDNVHILVIGGSMGSWNSHEGCYKSCWQPLLFNRASVCLICIYTV